MACLRTCTCKTPAWEARTMGPKTSKVILGPLTEA